MGITFMTGEDVFRRFSDDIASTKGFTYEIFRGAIKDLATLFKKQDGHYYVLLSLEEAEHFRAIMHGRMKSTLLSTEANQLASGRYTTAALWALADHDMALLGASRGFTHPSPAQHLAMVNSYRFVNSDVYFDDKGLTVLLRILEGSACEEREKWWTEMRACRRRRQIPCDRTMPVSTVFSTATEFQFMEFKAVVDRVQLALQERGMLVFDAFRAFNSSNTGLMTCSELYGGLDFLGIPFTPDQVYDLVRKLALQNEVCQLYCLRADRYTSLF